MRHASRAPHRRVPSVSLLSLEPHSIEARTRRQRPLLGGKRKHPECAWRRRARKKKAAVKWRARARRHCSAQQRGQALANKTIKRGRHQWQQQEMGREPTLASAEAKNSSSMTSLPSPRALSLSRPFPAPLLPFSQCASVGNAVSFARLPFPPSFFPVPAPQIPLFISVLCLS